VCHVPPEKFLLFLNMLEKNVARLVRKAGLGPTAQSGLPDWINAGLEAGLPRFRERHQKPKLPISSAARLTPPVMARFEYPGWPALVLQTRPAARGLKTRLHGFAVCSDHWTRCSVVSNGTKTVVGLPLSDFWTT